MNVLDMKKSVQDFCEARNWDQFHNPKDLARGLVTEASELLEIFRFKSSKECMEIMRDPSDLRQVQDELADVTFLLLRFVQLYQIDLEAAFYNKLEEIESKYPVEKFYGK
ncbi:MAG: nucleotide pyrophosphohydrolase, partial [Bdellovibrionales bacterium]|nr:nucleotide pyrophosphohydrolase [Bdellovibrionales bacterium]